MNSPNSCSTLFGRFLAFITRRFINIDRDDLDSICLIKHGAKITSYFIDLVTVFDAILTSRQTCEKLQCLYENLMSNNFRKTAVLKNTNCKLKLQSKGLH